VKLAQIILPAQPHLHTTHLWLEQQLFTLWRGYTAVTGQGAWQDDEGNGAYEPVVIYHVAMERADVIKLRILAQQLATISNETCIMIVTPNGDVEFVKREENNSTTPLTPAT
jgi:hypothetical protein